MENSFLTSVLRYNLLYGKFYSIIINTCILSEPCHEKTSWSETPKKGCVMTQLKSYCPTKLLKLDHGIDDDDNGNDEDNNDDNDRSYFKGIYQKFSEGSYM